MMNYSGQPSAPDEQNRQPQLILVVPRLRPARWDDSSSNFVPAPSSGDEEESCTTAEECDPCRDSDAEREEEEEEALAPSQASSQVLPSQDSEMDPENTENTSIAGN